MISRRKWFDYSFLALGLLIQVLTYIITVTHLTPGESFSVLSLVSGMLGVCSVCLCSQGNILTYLFGFAQVGTYTYLCYTNDPIRAIRRIHKTQSGGVKTTTVENGVGAWEDRASLTYYPVNEAIPEAYPKACANCSFENPLESIKS